MPSVWIERRTGERGPRWRVRYRVAGGESAKRYGGSFTRKEDALARSRWIAGELAGMRIPDVSRRADEPGVVTVAAACDTWRASRVDVTEATRVLHRVALNRVIPVLGERPVDAITTADVNELVTTLTEKGNRRETIRKSVKYLAAVLDECGRDPNPARSKSIRLPHEEHEEIWAPAASHVEAVFERVDDVYRLPLLLLDWSGARVSSIYEARVGDYDRINRRIRLRASTTKSRSALWIELPDVLATAIEGSLGNDVDGPIFEGNANALRTAIGRACRDAGVPLFSPHDLRHPRISLLHAQGRSWAEIARFVGQRKLSLTADVYTHVLSDGQELDYGEVLA